MNPEIENMIREALRPYSADIADAHITRPGKNLGGITIRAAKSRLRFEDTDSGNLYFSGPIRPATVASFVENFWCWRVQPERQVQPCVSTQP